MADKDKIESVLKRIQKIVNAAGSPPVIVLGSGASISYGIASMWDIQERLKTSGAAAADHPLSLGKYTMDESSEAFLDGDKLFHRHTVIVGSTGSGKSYCVARIVEQMADLPNANQQWCDEKERHPIALLCDEAHLYVQQNDAGDSVAEIGLKSFERIAKEGRKYGVGLVIISQRPSEVNRTELSQCNNFVSLRLTNVED